MKNIYFFGLNKTLGMLLHCQRSHCLITMNYYVLINVLCCQKRHCLKFKWLLWQCIIPSLMFCFTAIMFDIVVILSLFRSFVLFNGNCENILWAAADEWGNERTHFTISIKLPNMSFPNSFFVSTTFFQNKVKSVFAYCFNKSFSPSSCHSLFTLSTSTLPHLNMEIRS